MSSPTARTLAVLREQGFRCQIVEKWIAQARKRVDLWGFIDILYMDTAIVGVQVTSGSNHAARRTKILTECREDALKWLSLRGVIQVRSWSRRKVGSRVRWVERITEITIDDFEAEA